MPEQTSGSQQAGTGGTGGANIGGLPEGANLFVLEQFSGMNTQADRSAIEDQECSWIENFIPIGSGNLRTLWGSGAVLFTATGGLTIVNAVMGNFGTTF